MHKKIINILILLFVSINMKAQTLVYNENQEIGLLNEKANLEECTNCYYLYNANLFDKNIYIKMPVIIEDDVFRTNYILEVTNEGKKIILKFNSIVKGNSIWLYLKKKRKNLFVIKKMKYSNDIYKKELNEDDFDYLPATQICFEKTDVKLIRFIYLDDLDEFREDNCYKCPINISIEDCISNKKKEYLW